MSLKLIEKSRQIARIPAQVFVIVYTVNLFFLGAVTCIVEVVNSPTPQGLNNLAQGAHILFMTRY